MPWSDIEVGHVLADKLQDAPGVGEQVFQIGNLLEHFLVLFHDLLAFQVGQAAELHVQDGLGLNLGKLEAGHQVPAGGFRCFRFTDRLYDGVDVIQRDTQTFQDVSAGLGLF